MNIESIFNEQTNITIHDIIRSIVEERIDSLIKEYYYQNKVNTATSHVEGKKVS